MTGIDWAAAFTGMAVGAVISSFYFAGLALGIRWALMRGKAAAVLLLSAGVRIAILLGAGWALLDQLGPWALFGYGGAFVLLRLGVTGFGRGAGKLRGAI